MFLLCVGEVPGSFLERMVVMGKAFVLCGCLLYMQANLIGNSQKMVVNVGVADLRSRPEPVQPGLQAPALSKDIGAEDSQVSFCECIIGEEVPDHPEWIKVSTQTQKKWQSDSWIGYPGFILRSCLKPVAEFPKYNVVLKNLWTPLYSDMSQTSQHNLLALGTRLEAQKVSPNWWKVIVDKKICGYLKACPDIYELTPAIKESEDELREKIVQTAYLFLAQQTPYVWGGRSPLLESQTAQITGIDCSGITQLSYLAVGFEIPRDSPHQYRAAIPIASGKDLKKADLIFFAKQDGPQISHVMIYTGDNYVIESIAIGSSVTEALEKGFTKEMLGTRKIDVKEVIGVDVNKIVSGITIAKNGKRVLLGSYFGSKDKLDSLRAIALGQRSTF